MRKPTEMDITIYKDGSVVCNLRGAWVSPICAPYCPEVLNNLGHLEGSSCKIFVFNYLFKASSLVLSRQDTQTCSVARTSSHKPTTAWPNSLGGIDGVFHLELSVDTEAKLTHATSGDGVSVSSFASGMGCSSEDTGYSSDQELASPDNYFAGKYKLGERKKHIANKLDILKYNCSKITHRTSRDLRKVLSQISPSAIHELDRSQSDLRGSNNILIDHMCSHKAEMCSNKAGMCTRTLGHIQGNDGVFLGNSDFRSSGTSSTSHTSDRSICSRNSSGTSCTDTSILTNIHSSDCTSSSVGSSAACPGSTSRMKFGYKSVYIDIPSTLKHDSDKPTTTVPGMTLCERILGIIPACQSEVDPMSTDPNTEVIIKSILPAGAASNRPGVSVGSVLHGVNDQQITWENMDALLCGIIKSMKVKLTLKSLRSDSSAVDLETLMNMLTSSVAGSHSWGQVAVMYISLDAVDSNSQDAIHDGLVYSFPSQQNSLHQLAGLFYTLSRLVPDVQGSSTIRKWRLRESKIEEFTDRGLAEQSVSTPLLHLLGDRRRYGTAEEFVSKKIEEFILRTTNTTLCCDGQETHVAYMEEGCDLLVFAWPAACVPVWQLNAALLEFSRLLRVLFTSVECAFRKCRHWVLLDSLLHYLFRKVLPGSSTKPCLLPATSDLTEARDEGLSCQPLMPFPGHIPTVTLPDDVVAHVDKVLCEFESSTLPSSPGNCHESRRKYIILGSVFFHRGQLVSSHLAPADLHDLGLYVQHLGLLDLTARSSVAQLVAWKEVYPTRFCQDIAEINTSFGYSEPNARWCCMIVGLKHGLLCSLLEVAGPTLLHPDELPLDVFHVDMAKSCLMRLQTSQLLAMLDVRVSEDSRSALAKSDYCATYVNASGENKSRLFSDDSRIRASHSRPLVLSQQSGRRTSPGPKGFAGNVETDNLCKYPHAKNIYPVENEGPVNSFLSSVPAAILTHMPISHKLSTSRQPLIYQYCYLDGLEGTMITGSDVDNSGVFHSQIITNFYKCCRQIHSFFVTNGGKESQSHSKGKDEGDSFEKITSDPNLRGMKEYGILMNFNHHQGDEDDRQRQSLEYWVIGRRMKYPYTREVYVCCHASASQSLVELAFKLAFGTIS